MDPTSLAVASITAASTITAAGIAARANANAREAREVGEGNQRRLDVIAAQTDPRQTKLIEAAVEQVAERHPQLISDALADEFVRTVLQSILEGNLEPRRRRDDRNIDLSRGD